MCIYVTILGKLSEVVVCKTFNITSYIAAVFEDVTQKERRRWGGGEGAHCKDSVMWLIL